MTLADQVKELWESNQEKMENKIKEWIDLIKLNKNIIPEARKSFHQWQPLRAYTSTAKLMKKGEVVFSLRFHGQEVADIKVTKGRSPVLCVSKGQNTNNQKLGAPSIPDKVNWDSNKAKEFRNYFKKHEGEISTHSPEHAIETDLINEMRKKTATQKFKGSFAGIQPVLYAGCPIQIPTPIIWDGKKPTLAKNSGNMDIVARRLVKGKRVLLSVWELKRRGTSAAEIEKSINQAIVYASTLRMMLRSKKCGYDWYRFFGFNGKKVPEKLEIEAVPTIAIAQKNIFENKIASFKDDLIIERDKIILCVAYYDEDLKIDFKEIK